MPFKITNFTVSNSLEMYKGGKKQSFFNSMAISVDNETEESVKDYRSRMAFECTKNNIKDALMSGFITLDEAKEMIEISKSNYSTMNPGK